MIRLYGSIIIYVWVDCLFQVFSPAHKEAVLQKIDTCKRNFANVFFLTCDLGL